MHDDVAPVQTATANTGCHRLIEVHVRLRPVGSCLGWAARSTHNHARPLGGRAHTVLVQQHTGLVNLSSDRNAADLDTRPVALRKGYVLGEAISHRGTLFVVC